MSDEKEKIRQLVNHGIEGVNEMITQQALNETYEMLNSPQKNQIIIMTDENGDLCQYNTKTGQKTIIEFE